VTPLPLLLPLLLGSYSMPETFEVDTIWVGHTVLERCIDGDVTIALSKPDAEGKVAGSYLYVSTEHGPRGEYKGSYELVGRVDGEAYHLEQVALEVRKARTEVTWRHGVMDLKRTGDQLSGTWVSKSNSCTGTIELTLQE
jgi:hypothetical protein